MLIDTVGGLAHAGDVPAIIFIFGREQCFEVARLLKSCRQRFTTDEEKATIEKLCDEALLPSGVAKELRPLLTHGIGIHHAGILPRYKQLVEQLALDRLIKFVVSTETIAARSTCRRARWCFRRCASSSRRSRGSSAPRPSTTRCRDAPGDRSSTIAGKLAITLAPEQIGYERPQEGGSSDAARSDRPTTR